MREETVNVAEAKKHFSELLGRVAYGKKQILPAEENDRHLADVRGWLDGDDPFFETIDQIVKERSVHLPRILKETDRE
ncbi:MAG: hypothetical protein ACYS5V_10550 [Planctomycetota bacterium]|jgi:hypothetical protein